jgi:hypothetical protein
MNDLMWKLWQVINEMKNFECGFSNVEKKMLIDFCGKRFVAEFREVENPGSDMAEDMKRIRYL